MRANYIADHSEYYSRPDTYVYPVYPEHPHYSAHPHYPEHSHPIPMPHYASYPTYPDYGYAQEQEDGTYVPYDFVPPPPPQEQRETSDNDRAVTPTQFDSISHVTPQDVLCGRGAPNVHHPGNQHFRSLVRSRQQEYASLRRPDKCVVVRGILHEIESLGGRFLRQMSSGEWIEVHEAIAYEKTCQALREYTKTRNKMRKKAASQSEISKTNT